MTTRHEAPEGLKLEDQSVNCRHESSVGAIEVPACQRRGLFGRFSQIHEIKNPKRYPRIKKWVITFTVAMAAMADSLGTTIVLPALHQISAEFKVGATTANLSVALYLLSVAIFPLWWSSFSEAIGRRTIYLVSFALFIVWNVLAALAKNIAMFIVMRMLAGGAAASVQAVGAGTIADVWHVEERGQAMGIYTLGSLFAPFLGPTIGGVLAGFLGWRSTQWFLAIYGVIIVMLMFLMLPETLKSTSTITETLMPQTSMNEGTHTSRKLPQLAISETRKFVAAAERIFIAPTKTLGCVRSPAVLTVILYSSTVFGALSFLNISLQLTFSAPPYRFPPALVGLVYIPGSVGYILGSVLGGRWADKIMIREAKKAKRYDKTGQIHYQPSDRLRENAFVAALLIPAALIFYGWTAERRFPWAVPLMASLCFGLGSMLVFVMVATMLTELTPDDASAGVAANNFGRFLFAAVSALVAQPLLDIGGNGWVFTGLGSTVFLGGVIIWALKRYGSCLSTSAGTKVGSDV